jgi:hypothetical protein
MHANADTVALRPVCFSLFLRQEDACDPSAPSPSSSEEHAAAEAAAAAAADAAREAERTVAASRAALAALLSEAAALDAAGAPGAAADAPSSGGVVADPSTHAAQYNSELCAMLRCVHGQMSAPTVTIHLLRRAFMALCCAHDSQCRVCVRPARRGVGGVELLSAQPGGMTLRLAKHALTLTLSGGGSGSGSDAAADAAAGSTAGAGGGAALVGVALEPPSVPVGDLAGGRDANRRVDVAVREVRCDAPAPATHVCCAGTVG